jgi:excisionase family DNA binding protein
LQKLWQTIAEKVKRNSVPVERIGGLIMTELLESVLQLANDLPRESLPEFLGELREVEVTALARLTQAQVPAPTGPDELVDVAEAARRLGVSKGYLYRHRELPFARRIGRKLLFSSAGISRYISRTRP